MTLVFELDMKNNATASKDRTGLFFGKPEFKISIDTGRMIHEWCNKGIDVSVDDVSRRIGDVMSIQDLIALYHHYPQFKEVLKPEFEKRKREILVQQEDKTTQIAPTTKFNSNGKLH
jgi:hypothetical protein